MFQDKNPNEGQMNAPSPRRGLVRWAELSASRQIVDGSCRPRSRTLEYSAKGRMEEGREGKSETFLNKQQVNVCNKKCRLLSTAIIRLSHYIDRGVVISDVSVPTSPIFSFPSQ